MEIQSEQDCVIAIKNSGLKKYEMCYGAKCRSYRSEMLCAKC